MFPFFMKVYLKHSRVQAVEPLICDDLSGIWRTLFRLHRRLSLLHLISQDTLMSHANSVQSVLSVAAFWWGALSFCCCGKATVVYPQVCALHVQLYSLMLKFWVQSQIFCFHVDIIRSAWGVQRVVVCNTKCPCSTAGHEVTVGYKGTWLYLVYCIPCIIQRSVESIWLCTQTRWRCSSRMHRSWLEPIVKVKAAQPTWMYLEFTSRVNVPVSNNAQLQRRELCSCKTEWSVWWVVTSWFLLTCCILIKVIEFYLPNGIQNKWSTIQEEISWNYVYTLYNHIVNLQDSKSKLENLRKQSKR